MSDSKHLNGNAYRRSRGKGAANGHYDGNHASRNGVSRNSENAPQTKDKGGESYYDSLSKQCLLFVAAIRMVTLVIWSIGLAVATYYIYATSERELPMTGDPGMNWGIFSPILGRGKDDLDDEWTVLVPLLWRKFVIGFGLYQVICFACRQVGLRRHLINPWVSLVMSFGVLWQLIGGFATLHMAAVPLFYWVIMKLRHKMLIWGFTGVLILHFQSEILNDCFQVSVEGRIMSYIFVIASAWNLSRSVSFCMDTWDRMEQERNDWRYLAKYYQYLFYFPLTVTGPFVTYEHFEREILTDTDRKDSKRLNLTELVLQLLRMVLLSCFIELILHVLYFQTISTQSPVLFRNFNIWTVCGLIFWLGQYFSLKYKVLYGIPSSLAEFDGLSMYPLPACVAYIHRYSVLWKDFDRGLYVFMVKYIYVPFIGAFNSWDPQRKINPELVKFLASFVCFTYVFAWHNISADVFLWTAFNFVGITVERIGGILKRQIDRVQRIEPVIWDFLIEPVVTVPLAAMSILNSSIFCGSLKAAWGFSVRLYETCSREYNYHLWIVLFLFCFTHVGVTVRTWSPFLSAFRKKVLT